MRSPQCSGTERGALRWSRCDATVEHVDGGVTGKQTDLRARPTSRSPAARSTLRVARALATIKRHAAAVNASLGVGDVDEDVATAIADAARRVEAGELDEQFPVDVYQTGSGTSTNMNVNEVLAALAQRALGHRVHPNDHVNASQSSNDTVPDGDPPRRQPAAGRRGAPGRRRRWSAAFRTLAERFRHVVKAGRDAPDGRHAGDARPGGGGVGRAAGAGAGQVACADARGPRRAAARRDRRRDGHQRAGRVRRGGDRRARPRRPDCHCDRPTIRWSTRAARARSPRRRPGCAASPWR